MENECERKEGKREKYEIGENAKEIIPYLI
jgi:hypothetical protein